MKRVEPGDAATVTLPWSEVCMHLKVAGQKRPITVLEHGVQILNWDGTTFSFPITHGEAGIYRDAQGLYIQDDQIGDAM